MDGRTDGRTDGHGQTYIPPPSAGNKIVKSFNRRKCILSLYVLSNILLSTYPANIVDCNKIYAFLFQAFVPCRSRKKPPRTSSIVQITGIFYFSPLRSEDIF